MRECLKSSLKGLTPTDNNSAVALTTPLPTPIKSESNYLSLLFFEIPIGIYNICCPIPRGINTLKFPQYV